MLETARLRLPVSTFLTEASNADFTYAICRSCEFTMAPSVARLCGQFRPFGFCRPPVQSPATFTAPFFRRPEPAEDDFFRSSVLLSLHGAPQRQFLLRPDAPTNKAPRVPTYDTYERRQPRSGDRLRRAAATQVGDRPRSGISPDERRQPRSGIDR
jgi:hypothetical protein